MKSARIRLIILSLLLYLAFVLLMMPATHVLGWAAQRGLPVALAGVEGTVWKGRAEQLRYEGFEASPVIWNWRPLGLIAMRLEHSVYFQVPGGGGELRAGRGLFDDWGMRDVQAQLAADALAPWMPAGAALAGNLSLDVGRIALGNEGAALQEGRLHWTEAAITAPVSMELGNLIMDFQHEGSSLEGEAKDEGGPLEIDARISLTPNGRYQLKGTVKPRASAPPEVGRTLGLLGRADRQGRYPLNFSGSL